MRRLKKAILMPARSLAYRWNLLRLYYWADGQLYDLRMVYVMPKLYYNWLYQTSMWLNDFSMFRRLADRAIHTIPYQVRFEVA